MMVKLLDSGITCARLNLAQGNIASNLNLLANFKLAKRLRPHLTCGLMIEVRGRQVRVSDIKDKSNQLRLKSGSKIKMVGGKWPMSSSIEELRISSDAVCKMLKANDLIHFDNGKVVAIVRAANEREASLEVKLGGTISGNCNVRFVGGKHAQLEILQRHDLSDMQAVAATNIVDFVAVPHVASSHDILEVRRQLGKNSGNFAVVAKIDMDEGVHRFEDILATADGAILARDHLAYEISAEKLMLVEKWACGVANELAKPIMIQSQLLPSMIKGDEPERKELAEISQMVLNGSDCLILDSETAIGKHPLKALEALAKGIAEAETVFDYDQAYFNQKKYVAEKGLNLDILAHTGCQIAYEQKENVDMFVCMTETGLIARHVAKQRPKQPILACCTSGQAVRQMNMMRGIVGYKVPEYDPEREEELLELILTVAQEQLICNLPNSKVIIFYGKGEADAKSIDCTFKVLGGEKEEDENDEEDEEEIDEGDDAGA